MTASSLIHIESLHLPMISKSKPSCLDVRSIYSSNKLQKHRIIKVGKDL